MKTRDDVLARIREYYEKEFPESELTIEDTENIGLAYTVLYWDEVPEEHWWYNYLPLPAQTTLNLENLTATIHLGTRLVDSHTFADYDELYDWVDGFSFEDIFSLKI